MKDEYKRETLTKATEMCGKLLIGLMNELDIPNYIETTILDVKNNNRYKLRIEKLNKDEKTN